MKGKQSWVGERKIDWIATVQSAKTMRGSSSSSLDGGESSLRATKSFCIFWKALAHSSISSIVLSNTLGSHLESTVRSTCGNFSYSSLVYGCIGTHGRPCLVCQSKLFLAKQNFV